jgi:HK97 family phage portal protein
MWPFRRKPRASMSISDPLVMRLFGASPSLAGVEVTEQSALGISAFYRAGALISGTIAGLPLRSLRTTKDDLREKVPNSWIDNPAGPDSYTPFEWTEMVVWHLFLHGNAYLIHRFNGAGALVGLYPVHPWGVHPEWDSDRPGGKKFTVTLEDGTKKTYDARTMTQIMGPSLDGLRGMSVLTLARNSLGTSIAADNAAARMYGNGMLVAAIASYEDNMTTDEAKVIKSDLNQQLTGAENAGEIALINRNIKLTQVSQSAADAQFLQSRQFQVEEVSRWTGVPPHLLMQTEKQTSWGTGVSEQNRGLRQFNLMGWTSRFEQRLSRLLPRPQLVEFDYAGFLRPSPEEEIGLLIQQVDAGLITVNEARRIRNMPPVSGGDTLRTRAAPATEEAA